MSRVSNKLQVPSDKVFGFFTEKKILQHYYKHRNYTIIAIVFSGNDTKIFEYSIKYHGKGQYYDNEIFTKQMYSSPTYHFVPGQENTYIKKGLIHVQKTLDLSFIEYSLDASTIKNITIAVQEFPYPSFVVGTEITSLFLEYLPMVTLFSFIFLCPTVLKRAVIEKSSGNKELLKMFGIESWIFWLGRFTYELVPIIFSVIIIVILMKIPMFGSVYPPMEHSHFLLLFFFLLFYCMASITFCFAISSLFSKPIFAMITGIFVWITSYFLPVFSLNLRESNKLSWTINILLNFLPNMALHYGYSTMSTYEERGTGIQWNNFYQSASGIGDDVTMLNIFLMLWLDMLLFLTFVFFMDGINPAKSLLFSIDNLVKLIKKMKHDRKIEVDYEIPHLENIEEGLDMNKGIQIRGLYKRYGNRMVVNNLNLDIYKNQITVLLGHNGAGKSTLISMITGMLEMTSGSIKINGCDIKNNIDGMRQHLGLYPQPNLLFTDITVEEHLLFFAKLKGKSINEAEIEVNKLLKDLNLHKERNKLPHTLSGEIKMMLCLGLSLVGGSEVLILDNPSSRMDPNSQRQLWKLLRSWRERKTILITTHSMEEADALGDRIAIMANGVIQCYGTPMFLKKQYNTGCHLSLVVKKGMAKNEVALIRNEISSYLSVTQLETQDGQNLVFVLPFTENNSKLSCLLEALEPKKGELGIENISITDNTLEDVFAKAQLESSNEEDKIDSLLIPTKTSTTKKFRNKMISKTLFHKRNLFLVLEKFMNFPLLPIGFSFFFFIIYLTRQGNSNVSVEGTSLACHLKMYSDTSVYYNGISTHTNAEVIEKLKTSFKQLVEADGSKAFQVFNVSEAIIQKGEGNIGYYKKYMIAAAEFSVTNSGMRAVALYNAVALHSLPISLNLVTNAIAKTLLGNEYSISTSYLPLESLNV